MKPHRLAFIDLLRGLACLWMIETHVVDVTLSPQYQSGWLYDLLSLTNGFVAVGFIFCAGAGLWLALLQKGDEYRHGNPSLKKYMRRLGFLLLVGYWLNLPLPSFRGMLHASLEDLRLLFNCDILQAIVYSSLISILLFLACRRLPLLKFLLALLALLVFFSTPLVWSVMRSHSLPFWLMPLLSKYPVSKFPLFPWMGYFFSGAALTGFFMETSHKKRFALLLAGGSLLLIRVVFFLKDLPLTYPGWTSWQDWGFSSPGHSFFRLSGVVFLFAVFFLVENRWGSSDPVSRFLKLAGQESLFFYVVHTMIVYGTASNIGLRYYASDIFGPWSVLILTGALTGAVWTGARLWHTSQRDQPQSVQNILITLGVLSLTLFLLMP